MFGEQWLDKRPGRAYDRFFSGLRLEGAGVDIDILGLLFRWLHILAAITAVGGTIFSRAALLPAAAELADDQRAKLMENIRRRWSKFVMAAILFLLVSGFYNFFMMMKLYKLPWPYQMLFGIKFLLALAIFFIASLLAGRSKAAQSFRQKAKFWLSVNIVLAVILVCISGVLRALPHTPKAAVAAPAANPSADKPAAS